MKTNWFGAGMVAVLSVLLFSASDLYAATTYSVELLEITSDKYQVAGQSPSWPFTLPVRIGCTQDDPALDSRATMVRIDVTVRNGTTVVTQVSDHVNNPAWGFCIYESNPYDPWQSCRFDRNISVAVPAANLDTTTYSIEVNAVIPAITGDILLQTGTGSVDFTLFSGQLTAGANALTFTSINPDGDSYQDCPPAVNPNILSIGGVFRGNSFSDPSADLCVTSSPNIDGVSVDLTLTGGDITLGELSGNTASGLGYRLGSTELSSSGVSYSSIEIDLPDGLTRHEMLASPQSRPNPRGETSIIINDAGAAATPDAVTVTLAEGMWLYSYGLPFYIGINGFTLDFSGVDGMVIQTSSIYHSDLFNIMKLEGKDPRKLKGFPSNDIVYFGGTSTQLFVTSNGVQGDVSFRNKDAFTSIWHPDYDPQTHFPRGDISWGAYTLTLVNGKMTGTTIPDVDYAMDFSGSCPDGTCGDSPSGTDFSFTGLTLATGRDGALGGLFTGLADDTRWGKFDSGRFTFEKRDGDRQGALYIPGNTVPDSAADDSVEGKYTIAQYLFGSREFRSATELGSHNFLNDPDSDEASNGNDYFAGLTLGPQALEPSVSTGVTDLIDATDLSVLFNGETTAVSFDVTDYTKYVIRPGGITGVFNTTFSGPLSIYGYELQLDRFAFRQDVNELDDESFIDGHLDLPHPAELTVEFSSLEMTCTGDMAGGQIENGDNGKSLRYWNTPVTLLGMGFEDTDGNIGCPDAANRQLRLDSSNQVNGVGERVTLSAFWNPGGEPSQDTITASVAQRMDTPESGTESGFSVVLKDGYLNHSASYASPDVEGFTNLNMLVDIPLFDDMPVLGHFQNGELDSGGTVDERQYDLYLFKDEGTDADMNGIPDLGAYSGWDFATYRGELGKDDPELTPDPRPLAEYSWAGLINLAYPLMYDRAETDKSPQFRGAKQTSELPGGSDPVITISSVPDYIKPDKSKLSFGATADVANLKNFHVDMTSMTGDLDTFLANQLNVSIPIEGLLNDMVNSTNLMHSVTGGDITGLLEPVLDTALDSGPVSNGFNTLSTALRKIHNAPKVITSQIENRINTTRDRVTGTIAGGLTNSFHDLYSSDLAALAAYSPDALQASGHFTSGELDTLQAGYNTMTTGLRSLKGSVSDLRGELASIRTSIQGVRDEVTTTSGTVSGTITTLNNAIDDLVDYTNPDIDANPLLSEISTAKNHINSAITSVKNLNIQQIADALKQAASLSGGSIDTSMLDETVQQINSRVEELEQLMTDAENELESAISSAGLNTIFTQAKDRINFVGNHITTLETQVNSVFDLILVTTNGLTPHDGGYLGILEESLGSLDAFLNGLDQSVTSGRSMYIDPSITTRAALVQSGRDRLNDLARGLITDLSTLDSDIGDYADTLLAGLTPGSEFIDVFETGLESIVTAPLDEVIGGVSAQIDAVVMTATQFIPDASPDDLKEMVKGAILNSAPVQSLNTAFFNQFGFISDYVDDLSGELTSKVNGMINETIAAVSEGLNSQLANVSSDVGGSGGGMSAAKMDGYAIISQDELERIHIDAEFEFGGKPDPTIYYAILDITNWNAENGKGSACPMDTGGESMFDVVISTKDVKADMLGTSIGIKTASLGFTFLGVVPKGIFGNVYTSGELNFEALVLKDMGLEAGIGAYENYLGAKATGKFEKYTIAAIFFFGKTCDFEVLKRLDKDVVTFIGEHDGFTGVYVRGGAEIPIFNYGCALRVGVGAEVGAWYMTQPVPTYGGMFGGSAYGRVACLAALKGSVLCSGSKSGDQYRFHGSGWGAGGIGWCEPSKWSSVGKSRKDSWCVTGDATFEATYSGGWEINGPDIHCCY